MKPFLLGQAKENVNYTTAKLVLVGDSGVGKTGLGWRLAHGEFKEHASTHGQQFWSIPELGLKRKDGTECEAVLWDLAGQPDVPADPLHLSGERRRRAGSVRPKQPSGSAQGRAVLAGAAQGQRPRPLPTVLVGARADRGAPALSRGGTRSVLPAIRHQRRLHLSTSAMRRRRAGRIARKPSRRKSRGSTMTATVTTVTFKRIKDYVLSLKEKTDRKGVLVSPAELRKLLDRRLPKILEDFRKSGGTSPTPR